MSIFAHSFFEVVDMGASVFINGGFPHEKKGVRKLVGTFGYIYLTERSTLPSSLGETLIMTYKINIVFITTGIESVSYYLHK